MAIALPMIIAFVPLHISRVRATKVAIRVNCGPETCNKFCGKKGRAGMRGGKAMSAAHSQQTDSSTDENIPAKKTVGQGNYCCSSVRTLKFPARKSKARCCGLCPQFTGARPVARKTPVSMRRSIALCVLRFQPICRNTSRRRVWRPSIASFSPLRTATRWDAMPGTRRSALAFCLFWLMSRFLCETLCIALYPSIFTRSIHQTG